MALRIFSYNILAGGEDRLPSFAARLKACDIVTGAEAEMASDHFPVWAEFK